MRFVFRPGKGAAPRLCVVAALLISAGACGDSDSGGGDTAATGDAAAMPDAEPPDAARHIRDGEAPDATMDGSAPHDGDSPNQPDGNLDDAGNQAHDGSARDDTGPPDPDSGPAEGEPTLRIVTLGLQAPWEVLWGFDHMLWITERVGKRVIRVDPQSGDQATALDVNDAYQVSGQDGVLGMALDPRLGTGSGADYVYLAYTYDAAQPNASVDRRAKIVRYTYDASSHQLGSALVLIEGLPASGDHNSGRLIYGPDDKLYYTIGDQGHNQFDNMCLEINAQALPSQAEVDAQDWSLYQGKILRLGLDGSIPADNPSLGGVRSHIYTYGHRNAQGIVFGLDGKLYSDEQGPKTDDELNLIVAGKNYGWPQVAGYRDDKAYVYGNWSASTPTPCDDLTFSDYSIPASVPKQRESDWTSPDFMPPLMTFYTVDDDFDFMDPACTDNDFICWPTIAPSSLDLYVPGSTGLQSWGTSLLLTSLKAGSVFRVRLSSDGQTTAGPASELFKTINRYRDLAIAPDKRTFYIITDSEGATSGPTSGSTQQLDQRGALLEFRYAP